MEMLSVKCKDQYGNSIDFNKDNNYTIIEVTGINPIKSQINTSTIIGAPGSLFNYSHAENRSIVLYVAIDDYGSDARMRLNKMFRTGMLIDLFFNEYSIQGYVESNEYNAFEISEAEAVSPFTSTTIGISVSTGSILVLYSELARFSLPFVSTI